MKSNPSRLLTIMIPLCIMFIQRIATDLIRWKHGKLFTMGTSDVNNNVQQSGMFSRIIQNDDVAFVVVIELSRLTLSNSRFKTNNLLYFITFILLIFLLKKTFSLRYFVIVQVYSYL